MRNNWIILMLLFIIPSLCFTLEAWEYQEKGWNYYNAGKADKALSAFLNSIEVDDENGWGYYGAGLVYKDLFEDYELAETYLLKATDLQENPADSWQSLGWLYNHTEEYDMMLNAFISNLIYEPENGWGYYGTGLALQNLERYEEAAEFYLTATDLLPETYYIWTTLGWMYINMGYYQSAAEAFLEYADKVPDEADGFYGAAYAYQLLENREKAINYYENAVDIEPDHDDAWNSLGWQYWNTESYEKALDAFLEVIELAPDNRWGSYGAGLSLQSLDNYEEALDYFLEAEELFPDDDTCMENIFLCYFNLENEDKIIEYAHLTEKFYRDNGEQMEAWIPLSAGNYLVYTSQFPQPETAIVFFEMVHSGDYDESDILSAYEGLAYSYYLLNDIPNALNYAKYSGEDNWIYKKLAPRKITLNYDVPLVEMMTYFGKTYQPGTYYVELPLENEYQEVISVSSTPSYTRIVTYNNEDYAEIDFSGGIPERFQMEVVMNMYVTNLAADNLEYQADNGSDLAYFIDNETDYTAGDKKIRKTVKKITDGLSEPMEKIKAIHEWIATNFTHIYYLDEYDNDDPTCWPEYDHISEMLDTKVGHCYQFSQLFAEMVREVGIPARIIGGAFVDGYDDLAGEIEAHYTVEVWDEEHQRWFYVEPQSVYNFGINNPDHIIFWKEKSQNEIDNIIDIYNIQQNCVKYLDDPGGNYTIEYMD